MTLASQWQPGDNVRLGTDSASLLKPVGSGAEGEVWRLHAPFDHLVVKLFNDPPQHRGRLNVLISAFTHSQCNLPAQPVAAPEALAYRDDVFVGVAAQYLGPPWRTLEDLFKSREVNLVSRLTVARRLAAAVSAIHSRGFIIGDLNPANLLWNLPDNKVVFVDADSWGYVPPAIDDDRLSGLLPAVQPRIDATKTKADYQQPHHRASAATSSSDRFALALIILETLTGLHPYASRRQDTDSLGIEERMSLGHCWLLAPSEYRLPTRWFPNGHPGLPFFPPSLDAAARRVLTSGSGELPSAYEWKQSLGGTSVTPCLSCRQPVLAGGQCPSCRSPNGSRPIVRPSGRRPSPPIPPPGAPAAVAKPPTAAAKPPADADWTAIRAWAVFAGVVLVGLVIVLILSL